MEVMMHVIVVYCWMRNYDYCGWRTDHGVPWVPSAILKEGKGFHCSIYIIKWCNHVHIANEALCICVTTCTASCMCSLTDVLIVVIP